MQNQTSGGIFTHVMPNGGHGDSDTNTETTALVVLGITSIQSERPTTNLWLAVGSFVIVVVAFVVLAIVIVAIRRRRGRIYPQSSSDQLVRASWSTEETLGETSHENYLTEKPHGAGHVQNVARAK